MSAGTSAGLLDQRHAQSVFKHAILDTYVVPSAEMGRRRKTTLQGPDRQPFARHIIEASKVRR